MRAMVVIGFVVAQAIQIAVWFGAAFYEVEYGEALPYWSLLGLGIFAVPVGFFACYSRQLRLSTAVATLLLAEAAAVILLALRAEAIAVPGVTLLEGAAPFIPGLILLGCVWGMGSQGRTKPTI